MKLRHVRVDAVGIDLARGGCTGGGGGPQGMQVDAVGSWRLAFSGVESLPRAVVHLSAYCKSTVGRACVQRCVREVCVGRGTLRPPQAQASINSVRLGEARVTARALLVG